MIDNHAKAAILEDIQKSALIARDLCTTARIHDLLNNINDKTIKLIDGLGLKEYVADIKERRIDPTM